MRSPEKVTVAHYKWRQLRIVGHAVKDDKGRIVGWQMPPGMETWLLFNIKEAWAVQSPSAVIPIFIKDQIDAIRFKLTWYDDLTEI